MWQILCVILVGIAPSIIVGAILCLLVWIFCSFEDVLKRVLGRIFLVGMGLLIFYALGT